MTSQGTLYFPYRPKHFNQCYLPRMKSKKKYCKRLDCIQVKCRDAKYKEIAAKLHLGAGLMGNQAYAVTLKLLNPDESTYSDDEIWDLSKRFSDLFGILQKVAKEDGIEFLRVDGFGIKTVTANAPYQLHSHALISWLPTGKSLLSLQESAAKLGLHIYIEVTDDPHRYANYILQNIKSLDGIDLPPKFRRVRYNNKWPKLDIVRKRAAWNKIKQLKQLKENLDAVGVTYYIATWQAFIYSILRPKIIDFSLPFGRYFAFPYEILMKMIYLRIWCTRITHNQDTTTRGTFSRVRFFGLLQLLCNNPEKTSRKYIVILIWLLILLIMDIDEYSELKEKIPKKKLIKPQNNYPNQIMLQGIIVYLKLLVFIVFNWLSTIY